MLEHLNSSPTLPARTVVVGAGGFVGSAIVKRLERAGAPLLALTRNEVDLLSPEAERALAERLRPDDAVVFVSALAPCKDIPTLMSNLRMVEASIAGLEAAGLQQIVYISSDAVYADGPGPITEESAPVSPSLHGTMHRVRELMLATIESVPLAILRPSLLYGIADPHNGYGPNRFRRTAAREGKITLFGDGEEKRDHVFIDDLAEIVLQTVGGRSRGVLNVATGRSVSFRQAAEGVASCFPRPVEIVGLPRTGPITHRHFDITALLKSFPELRPTPLEDGLSRVHSQMAEESPA
jgi:nucleoside-diphosphate-sugar epimerase